MADDGDDGGDAGPKTAKQLRFELSNLVKQETQHNRTIDELRTAHRTRTGARARGTAVGVAGSTRGAARRGGRGSHSALASDPTLRFINITRRRDHRASSASRSARRAPRRVVRFRSVRLEASLDGPPAAGCRDGPTLKRWSDLPMDDGTRLGNDRDAASAGSREEFIISQSLPNLIL